MSAKKPVKRRDIYEATQADYDTVDYRRKLCDQWIEFQREQPVSMLQPSDLGSNVTQNATPANSNRKRANQFPADKYTMPKQNQRDVGEKTKLYDFKDSLRLDDFADFDDAFVGLDFEFPDVKPKASKFDHHMEAPETKLRGTKVQTATQSKNHKQSQSNDLNHSTNRTKVPGYRNDDDKFAGFEWSPVKQHVRFGSGSMPKKKPETYCDDDRDELADFNENPLNPPTKTIERKRHNDNHDVNFGEKFHSERNLFDSKASPKHVIYKRVKKSSYSMLDATPIQMPVKHSYDDFYKESKAQKMIADDFLFKKPDNKRNAYEKCYYASGEHRDPRKNRQIDHEVVISNEIQRIKPLIRHNANKEFHELKPFRKYSLTQPIVFNIKCNNLIIKTD